MLFQTLTLIGVFLVALAALGTAVWYAQQAAERTDRPAVRLLIRTGVSLLLGLGGLPVIQLILSRMTGGLAQGFGIALLGAAVFVAIAVLLATLWAPEIGSLIFAPLEALLTGGSTEPEVVPVYSPAKARRNRGDFPGALAAVREQLGRFPHDWEGWRLLADIQGADLQDIPAARATMLELVVDPRQSLEIRVAALNWLADSHQASSPPDLDAARRLLEQILELDPGSPAGHAAYQRLAHLAELERAQGNAPLAVPEASAPTGLRRRVEAPPPRPGPQEEADRCLTQLERFPDDHEAREQLARLYADELGRPDLAVGHLARLAGLEDEPVSARERWLTRLAELEEGRGDAEAANRTRARLAELLGPDGPAEVARRHLAGSRAHPPTPRLQLPGAANTGPAAAAGTDAPARTPTVRVVRHPEIRIGGISRSATPEGGER